ncbi:unnamed protein product [Nippostrongylus brasiliensis]|uniref:EH domain-containing protein n=1 Tax=Nippostrongylus brasiliensis TaxID=27835 RepID=A0A0N4YL83_NIPBR|nr:unnamed protein product [Nippostrongylus brasiliensis]
MVYDASLGYDPDEWEECPPKEQFMVFSFFTRLLLSTAAVVFVDEPCRQSTGSIIAAASRKLEQLEKSGKESADEVDYTVGGTAEDLLKEAQQYMREPVLATEKAVEEHLRGVDEAPLTLNWAMLCALKEGSTVEQVAAGQVKNQLFGKDELDTGSLQQSFTKFIEEPRRRAEEFSKMPPYGDEKPVTYGVAPFAEQQQQQQQMLQGQFGFGQGRPEDQQALRQWELERERLESERLAKLQDLEAGGEESELTSSGLLPASHISFPSQATPERDLADTRQMAQARDGLEKKLLTEIGQIAEASPTVKRERQMAQARDGLEKKLLTEIGQIAEASPTVKRESTFCIYRTALDYTYNRV